MRLKIIILIAVPSMLFMLASICMNTIFLYFKLPNFQSQSSQLIDQMMMKSIDDKFRRYEYIIKSIPTNLDIFKYVRLNITQLPQEYDQVLENIPLLLEIGGFQSLINTEDTEIICQNGLIVRFNGQIDKVLYNDLVEQCLNQTVCDAYLQGITQLNPFIIRNNTILFVTLINLKNITCAVKEYKHQFPLEYFNNSIIESQGNYFQILNNSIIQLTEQPRNISCTRKENHCNITFMHSSYNELSYEINLSSYLSAINFIILMLFIYNWRLAVKTSHSFVLPLQQIVDKIINQSISQLEEQEFSNDFEEYSREITAFMRTLFLFLNSIKFQSNKMGLDAISLINLSQAKQFFKEFNNLSAVGLCCNNIARIHANSKRYLEALNEQEESIQYAEQELECLLQVEKFQSSLSSYNWQDAYKGYKNKFLHNFFREDQILEKITQQNFSPQILKGRSATIQSNLLISYGGYGFEMPSPSPEEQILEDEEIRMMRIKLINRKYQLLLILIRFCNENDQLFMNEAFNLLKELSIEVGSIKPQNEELMDLQFSLQTKLIYFYVLYGKLQKAQKYLQRINFRIKRAQDTIPYLQAIIEIQLEKVNQAAHRLIDIVKLSPPSSPQFKQAFNLLKAIFQHYNLRLPILDNFEIKQKQFEIILLIDYTNDIMEQQIQQAHSIAKYILSQLNDGDIIGLYAYNECLHQIFQKQQINSTLQIALNQILIHPGGQCKLLQILQEVAITLFSQNEPIQVESELENSRKFSNYNNHNNRPMGDILDATLQTDILDQVKVEERNLNKQKLIVLFAEQFEDYSKKEFQVLKKILLRKNIDVILIGIAKQKGNQCYLQQLQYLTQESRLLCGCKEIVGYFNFLYQKKEVQYQYLEFF